MARPRGRMAPQLQLRVLREHLRRECPECHGVDVEAILDRTLRLPENLDALHAEIRRLRGRRNGDDEERYGAMLARYGAGPPRAYRQPVRRAARRVAARIAAHPRVLRTCRWCRRQHSPGVHRFHGVGSYARTHGGRG